MRLGKSLSDWVIVAWCLLGIGWAGKHCYVGVAVSQKLRVRGLASNTRAPLRVSLHPSLERAGNSRNSDFSDDLDIPSNDEDETASENEETSTENDVTAAPVEVNITIRASEGSDNSAMKLQSNESDDGRRSLGIVLATLVPILVILLIVLMALSWRKNVRKSQPAEEDTLDEHGGDGSITRPLSKIPEGGPGTSILRTAIASVSLKL